MINSTGIYGSSSTIVTYDLYLYEDVEQLKTNVTTVETMTWSLGLLE